MGLIRGNQANEVENRIFTRFTEIGQRPNLKMEQIARDDVEIIRRNLMASELK